MTVGPAELGAALRLHPRVAAQGIASPERRATLLAGVPALVPFPGASYQGLLAVLDWDHRLPSRTLVVRAYGYYGDESLRGGEQAFAERLAAIEQEDRFPEFDVPDFSEIAADEAYEFDLSPDGALREARHVSSWRHDIEDRVRAAAVEVVAASREFAEVRKVHRHRPPTLGEPEAVQWSAPCESGQTGWTVDVWYLTGLAGSEGQGRSFLVDVDRRAVVACREFLVQLA